MTHNASRFTVLRTGLMFCTLCLILLSSSCLGDPNATPVARPHFAAVIVSDVATASTWYQRLLNLKVKNEMNDNGGAYHIIILTSPEFELELLELKGSVARRTCLTGKPAGTEVQGMFKTGFDVPDMDGWIAHLKSLNITIPQIWTDKDTGKRNFLITDPEGNLIQFFER